MGELKTAIVTQQLPYFMIPERNLMAASGLQDNQQSKWVADITDMMAEGPRVILRLPKIRQAFITSLEPLLWFNKRRMELERLNLEYLISDRQCRNEQGLVDDDSDFILVDRTDAILQDINRRSFVIMMEDIERMLVEGCALNDLMDIHPQFQFFVIMMELDNIIKNMQSRY
ncbi:hypothetical protein DPMN_076688 [Dreissena polymorpha]|uniref:Uncharacterized protein n=1 Tax=Dreissena polymorpha TaxID=45954 RepID=A0A9D3YNJ0_DREPO|nr:hypothetical protein DPMN_076688 [Dreissena polymorpha]